MCTAIVENSREMPQKKSKIELPSDLAIVLFHIILLSVSFLPVRTCLEEVSPSDSMLLQISKYPQNEFAFNNVSVKIKCKR